MENCPLIIWINLDRAEERRQKMIDQLEHHHLRHHRITAIDGSDKQLLDNMMVYSKMPKISRLQYACTMSHLLAHKYLLDFTHEESALIMEDDTSFEFLDKWPKPISTVISEKPSDCDILQLAYNIGGVHVIGTGKRHYIPQRGISSTLCYLITRKGARKLVSTFYPGEKFLFPPHKNPHFYVADVGLYKSVVSYTYIWALFTYPDNGDSQINRKNKTHQRAKIISKRIYQMLSG